MPSIYAFKTIGEFMGLKWPAIALLGLLAVVLAKRRIVRTEPGPDGFGANLDKLIVDGTATPDKAKRAESYEAAQQIIHDQVLRLPLGYPPAAAITHVNVSGYLVSPFGRQKFLVVSTQ